MTFQAIPVGLLSRSTTALQMPIKFPYPCKRGGCTCRPFPIRPAQTSGPMFLPRLSSLVHTEICVLCRTWYSKSTGDGVEALKRSRTPGLRSHLRKGKGDPSARKGDQEKGSVMGAVALIVGTSIGSGILALPMKTAPAGLIPTASLLIASWAFLLVEALLLAEVNVALMERMEGEAEDGRKLNFISFTTMAEATLGKLGAHVATLAYVFLAYSSMVAYVAKSGDILSHVLNHPTSVLGCCFTLVFTLLISVGGTKLTDQVNQGLTILMVGLVILIESTAVNSGGWRGHIDEGDWSRTPETLPVIIFSLVYHDLSPVLCAYLGGDISRIRLSVMLGSMVPLIILLDWDAIALGLSPASDGTDPVNLLMRSAGSCGLTSVTVETFSLLAVGTSLIGTLLGFSQFFTEQLSQYKWKEPAGLGSVKRPQKWWGSCNVVDLASMLLAVAPPLLLVLTNAIPDAFSTATDIAGGYCMTILYGVFPPAMAWSLFASDEETSYSGDDKHEVEKDDRDNPTVRGGAVFSPTILKEKPTLLGIGVSACGIIVEQLLQSFHIFRP
ncbi:uncharacterized protein LOC116252170 isoform X1 [Nymphaea colorata]|nr:uncharacterized protein LOC116252170 isoform X1 [Nymphaea colorata]